MIEETPFLTERFLRQKIECQMKDLLVYRTRDKGKQKRNAFSPIIAAISKEDSSKSASKVLETGFKALSDERYKASVAQALARHLQNNDKHSDAEKWAATGIELNPTTFAHYDTLGNVLKQKLR